MDGSRLIERIFIALFLIVPLIFFTGTSEAFEFNKLIAVYIATTAIVFIWLLMMIKDGKVIFKKTLLDIPIVIFLGSQILSTIFSFDVRTSILGYYARWNGGLASLSAYALLYWAYVTHIDQKGTKRVIVATVVTTIIASVWALLEHFGVNPSGTVWTQDPSLRPIATFGQPNWLAAWVAATSPLVWAVVANSKPKNQKSNLLNLGGGLFISILFLLALLFTKSLSGLLGFLIAFSIFWTLVLFRNAEKNIKPFLVSLVIFSAILFLVDVQPLIRESPSAEIRLSVWQGAFELWKQNPVIGTGVETFAHTFDRARPLAHNLTAEWNFTFSKAHNEYLNYLSTTGFVGLTTYLILIFASIYSFINYKSSLINLKIALLAGYIAILVTNFFGFSVVPINILFFLFPAMVISIHKSPNKALKSNLLNLKSLPSRQKFAILSVLLSTFYLLLTIINYWRADHLFARGNLQAAVAAAPHEPTYRVALAAELAQNGETKAAMRQLNLAKSLSPENTVLLQRRAKILLDISREKPEILELTLAELADLQKIAPTNPVVFYQTAFAQAAQGNTDEALSTVGRALELKPDYGPAQRLRSILLQK